MDQTVNLIPLKCIKCDARLTADPDQVAWVCPNCGQGMYLNDETGLQALEISYSSAIPQNSMGKPYWVAQGTVSVQRETFGKSANADAQKFWSQPHRFFVPAYQNSLENLIAQANQYLLQPPVLQAGPVARFETVTLDKRDVTAAAEFIVVAVEANRKDRLKKIDFTLQLSDPVLWILPA